MPLLPYLDDELYFAAVKRLYDKGRSAVDRQRIERNVIDPFSLIFEMACFDLDDEAWLEREGTRQAQKTLSNHIGIFHQEILGSVSGWKDLKTGGLVDVENRNRKIIAEVKNKHNTVKASDQVGIYKGLQDLVMPKGQEYKDYTAFYVEIVPKKPNRYNECFTPSDRSSGTRVSENELIRRIDGASFYELVTGEPDALKMLFASLPAAIKTCYPDTDDFQLEKATEYFRKAYEA